MGIVAGLTGGIGTGKSTVSAIFRGLGAYIIDADEIAKDVVRKGTSPWKEIKDLFGEEVLDPDGKLNRTKLGEVVFGDESKRKKLEEIVHPEVFKEIERQKEEILKEDRDAIIILDIPLLFESGYQKDVDKLIVVYAGEKEQISRLSGKLSREETLKRIKSQMPTEEKKKLADYIIDNTGSLKETEEQCRKIYEELKALKKKTNS